MLKVDTREIERKIAEKYDATHEEEWCKLSDDEKAEYYNEVYERAVLNAIMAAN